MAVAVEAVPKLVTLTVMVRVVTVLMFMEVAQKLAAVEVVVTTIALRLVVLVAAGKVGHATTQTNLLVLQTLVVEAVAGLDQLGQAQEIEANQDQVTHHLYHLLKEVMVV